MITFNIYFLIKGVHFPAQIILVYGFVFLVSNFFNKVYFKHHICRYTIFIWINETDKKHKTS